jgi:hypothetical protein
MHVMATDQISGEVRRFCAAHDLTDHLDLSLRLAEESFAPVQRMHVELQDDPDADEEHVLVLVEANMPVEEAIRRNGEYLRRWVPNAPWCARERIHLLYIVS